MYLIWFRFIHFALVGTLHVSLISNVFLITMLFESPSPCSKLETRLATLIHTKSHTISLSLLV